MLWHDRKETVRAIWVGIQGGSCAGKTSLAKALAERLGSQQSLVITLDRFYQPVDRSTLGPMLIPNYDHPGALDWTLLHRFLDEERTQPTGELPGYDYRSGLRVESHSVVFERYDCVIVEGLWPFYDPVLVDRFDIKVYLDTAADVRLTRRLRRDVLSDNRDWTLAEALTYYDTYQRRSHQEFVEPGRSLADEVLEGDDDDDPGIERLVASVKAKQSG